MEHHQIHHYEAFSAAPGMGNPAGVVLDADNMPEDLMQAIATRVGFNETAFVSDSQRADVRIRFFTPGHEIDLCGHATLASFYALVHRKRIVLDETARRLTLECKAGILSISLYRNPHDELIIEMEQAPPRFAPYSGDRARLAGALGVQVSDFHEDLLIVYASTGAWTLLVPLKHLKAIQAMRPTNTDFPHALPEMPKASVHPFCLDTLNPDADLHARHFSSPYSGTREDPVTGTASGAMGAYMRRYAQDHRTRFIIEQGQEIGRDGRVVADVIETMDTLRVRVSGTGVYVGELAL